MGGYGLLKVLPFAMQLDRPFLVVAVLVAAVGTVRIVAVLLAPRMALIVVVAVIHFEAILTIFLFTAHMF